MFEKTGGPSSTVYLRVHGLTRPCVQVHVTLYVTTYGCVRIVLWLVRFISMILKRYRAGMLNLQVPNYMVHESTSHTADNGGAFLYL